MVSFGALLVGAALVYSAVVIVGARRLLGSQSSAARTGVAPGRRVEIVVIARNEEESLPALREALVCQEVGELEVSLCLVDDASSDATPQVLPTFRVTGFPLRILRLGQGGTVGKKAGLWAALQSTQAELLVITDADCRPGKRWLQSLLKPLLENPRVVAVMGPVLFHPARGLWGKVVALEFLGLQVGAWLAAALGRPLSASAASLAFRRMDLAVEELHPELASGDDYYLVRALARRGLLRAVIDQDALVRTRAPSSAKEFLQQRVRWASKLVRPGSVVDLALLAVLYVFHLGLLMAPAIAPFVGSLWTWAASAYALKWCTDAWVMSRVLERVGLGEGERRRINLALKLEPLLFVGFKTAIIFCPAWRSL